METLKVLSIDIGITNLGYVYSRLDFYPPEPDSRYKANLVNDNYILNRDQTQKYIEILDCNRVDITKVKHNLVPFCDCTLHHDRCIPDYIDHFIQETPHFQECDILLLERQPPVGITNVQDLLFKQFRNKVILVHPASVHAYFDLPSCEYELRKAKSEMLSGIYLKNEHNFLNNTRRHDISDAMLMTLFYYKTKMEKVIKGTKFEGTNLNFEQFRMN
jgi:hypothetical protein